MGAALVTHFHRLGKPLGYVEANHCPKTRFQLSMSFEAISTQPQLLFHCTIGSGYKL
jgi:hypothetical protein